MQQYQKGLVTTAETMKEMVYKALHHCTPDNTLFSALQKSDKQLHWINGRGFGKTSTYVCMPSPKSKRWYFDSKH